jgi:hypothetical protein
MGNFLEDLQRCRKQPIAVSHRFRQEYDPDTLDVYAFFESADDRLFFYSSIRERAASTAAIKVYLCENKQGVWQSYMFAEQNDKLKNVVCFVDKDMDDFCNEALPEKQRIFVTDFYAIENYVGTPDVVSMILEHFVKIPSDHKATYDRIHSEFQARLEEFHSHVLPLASWVIAARRKGHEVQYGNLGNGLGACFRVDVTELKSKVACQDVLEEFRKRCVVGTDTVTAEEITAVKDELIHLNAKKWVRGKFELWFVIQLLNGFWERLVGYPITNVKKAKKTIHLTSDSIFSVLEGKLPRPNNLATFLCTNIENS